MGQKGNMLLLGIFIISFMNIIGFLSLPIASFFTLVFVILVHFRESLLIIYKTLPRDLKGIQVLIITRRKLGECEKNDWTVVDLLRQQVKKSPEKVCIYFEDQKWTFEDVEKYSNKIANAFHEEGYRKGDVVALLMGNCPEYVCLWHGLSKIGVVTALINNNLRNDSLLHCLRAASVKAIIFSDEYASTVEEISSDLQELTKYQFPSENASDSLQAKNLKNLIDGSSPLPPNIDDNIGYRDKAVYIYTSGTTGLPKPAIMLHHRLILMSMVSRILNITEDDTVYNPLPLYHTAGGIMGITGSLCHGYSVVLKKKFSASAYWPDCIKYNCTASQYIGEMCRYIQMVPPRPEDTKHNVRLIFGNGMRSNIMKIFKDRFKVDRIAELYGSTEGNANIVNLDKKIGAVGFLPKIIPASIMPMALIKVNEQGEPIRNKDGFCIRCQANEPGMFIGMILPNDATREYNGYIGSAKENEKKIVENVFKKGDKAFLSGDILVMDEYGYLYFKDRTGDTFRWKSENVSSAEVEDTITAVIGLREVSVYGVEVGTLEGRAGMATIVDPNEEVDLQMLHSELSRRLPFYARPLFLRLTNEVAMTGTYKMKKSDLQKEGFNPAVISDKLFFNNGSGYVELTADLYDQIVSGKIRI
ncbi:UNVERIFIED_CONTAM: hypothetical protein PYX00_006374 [Menopon gallinae]|uniref:Very long-chain fatty acid transport protein n=1 Tax=Menopon gallinae TaxID=328185 RepID=A0AAW2HWZ1_9NEOP